MVNVHYQKFVCVLHSVVVYKVAKVVVCHKNAHMLHVVVVCMVLEDVIYEHMLVML